MFLDTACCATYKTHMLNKKILVSNGKLLPPVEVEKRSFYPDRFENLSYRWQESTEVEKCWWSMHCEHGGPEIENGIRKTVLNSTSQRLASFLHCNWKSWVSHKTAFKATSMQRSATLRKRRCNKHRQWGLLCMNRETTIWGSFNKAHMM